MCVKMRDDRGAGWEWCLGVKGDISWENCLKIVVRLLKDVENFLEALKTIFSAIPAKQTEDFN